MKTCRSCRSSPPEILKDDDDDDWANAVVVKMVAGYSEWGTTEAILIKKCQEPINLDSGLLLPSV